MDPVKLWISERMVQLTAVHEGPLQDSCATMASSTAAKAVRTLLETKLSGIPAWAAQTLTKQNATAAANEFVTSYKVRGVYTHTHTRTFTHAPPTWGSTDAANHIVVPLLYCFLLSLCSSTYPSP